MRALFAFIKKEWMEWLRSGRITILAILFLLLGIMNPAIAKLTPWMMEMMSESLEEAGFIVANVEVDALTSWTQFFKNIPIGLIAFVLICSGIFTKEYQSGTLILVLTKGLKRGKVLIAKSLLLVTAWTIFYWFCYGITYFYNAYFWDNSIAEHLGFSVTCWWLFGVWVISLMILFSVLTDSNTGVLAGAGGVVFGIYLLSMIPKIEKWLPTKLMGSGTLLTSIEEVSVYEKAILITCIWMILNIFISFPIINKKKI